MTLEALFPRLAVFPLHGIVDGRCACGRDECRNVGKHPAMRWSELAPAEKVRGPGGVGYGIATGTRSGVFVVDLDGEDAVDTFGAFGPCPETFAVATPRGYHLYFSLPSHLVKTSAGDLAKGIDVRGEGGFVVAPGSPHRSGGTYVDIGGELAAAPAWLLRWPGLRKLVDDAAAPSPLPVVEGSPEEAECLEEAIKMLTSAPVSIAGQKGHGTLWVLAQRLMRSFELPIDTAYALLIEHYNGRCLPPWSGRELRHKLEQARDSGRFELRSDVERFNRDVLASINRKTA